MNEHEIGTFFTTAVRRLKNSLPYAEVKHLSCGVARRNYSKQETIALCDRTFYEEWMVVVSKIIIHPRVVIKHSAGWNEEQLRTTLLNTAAHEVAHHLEMHRDLVKLRNQICHGSRRQIIDSALKTHYDEGRWHGAEWQSIMEELGASAD